MRLIIHIGTPKTGTTSIQSMLGNNRDMLAQHDIRYPDADGSNAHNLLPAAFRGPEEHWAYHRKLYGNDPKRIKSAALKAWDRVFDSANAFQNQTVVLSSEGFSLLSETQTLKAFLAEKLPGVAPEIVVYLRHPVEWVQSILFQRVRRTTNVLPPMPLGWGGMLTRWEQLGPLTIRSMETDQLVNGDAVSDFASAILGLPADTFGDRPSKSNPSLSAEGTILVHDYRRVVQPDRNEERTEEVRALITELMKIENQPDMMSRRSRIRLRPNWRKIVINRCSTDMKSILLHQGFRFADDSFYAKIEHNELHAQEQFGSLREIIMFEPDVLNDLQARLTGVLLPTQIKQIHRGATYGLPASVRRLMWAGLRRMRILGWR
jgi:hypothetical protein